MSVRLRIRAAAIAALAGLAVIGAVACTDSHANSTQDAALAPPPSVPEPPPRGGNTIVVNLVAQEHQADITPNAQYTVWTFNGSVPGPLVRVRVGDNVEVHLKGDPNNTQVHNIDFHAATGPGGGADVTNVKPGEEATFTFKAKTEGLYVYHCAAGIVADHITNGMYGGILVDPPSRLTTVDHEYYVGQNEFYTTGDTGARGPQDLDLTKLMNEQATYVTFNGNTKAITGQNALQAKTGDKVRIYFVNGGPNYTSSFHVIGEILDRVWLFGGLMSSPAQGLQTVSVPPGGAAIVEFTVDVPGDYKLVDHATTRLSKGAVGILHVTGEPNRNIFDAPSVTPAPPTTATTAPSPSPSPVATVSPTAAASPGGATTGELKIAMKDNFFEPDTLTLKVGQKVTITLTNEGKVPHNMHIAPLDGNFDAAQGSVLSNPDLTLPGKTGELEWTPQQPGTYKFRCDVHPDQMTGTITVQ